MNLCDKYGGYETYHKIIYELYLDLFDHPEVSYHFVGVDPFHLSALQAQFVCRALGGNVKYKGRSLAVVHKDMNISEFQMNEVLNAFRGIFLKNGFESADVEKICGVLSRFAPLVVKCKLSWIDKIMILIYHLWDRISIKFKS